MTFDLNNPKNLKEIQQGIELTSETGDYIQLTNCYFDFHYQTQDCSVNLFDQHGNPVAVKLHYKGTRRTNRQLGEVETSIDANEFTIRYYEVARIMTNHLDLFGKGTCFVMEHGQEKIVSKLEKLLSHQVVSHHFLRSFQTHSIENYVIACSHCDEMFIQDNSKINQCPHCKQPYQPYYRHPYLLEANFQPMRNFLEFTLSNNRKLPQNIGYATLRNIDLILDILKEIAEKMPHKHFGPMNMIIGLERRYYGKNIPNFFAFTPILQNECIEWIRAANLPTFNAIKLAQQSPEIQKQLENFEKLNIYKVSDPMISRMKHWEKDPVIKKYLERAERRKKNSTKKDKELRLKLANLDPVQNFKPQKFGKLVPYTGVFLDLTTYHTNQTSMRIFGQLYYDGQPLNSTIPDFGALKEITFSSKGLTDFVVKLHQTQNGFLPPITLFMYEENQNLKFLVNEIGKKISLPKKAKPVNVCKHCDVMLIKYHFDYEDYLDEFDNENCPYCGKKLEIKSRAPKVVKVLLDKKVQTLTNQGTKNQIGIIYNNRAIAIKVTPKPFFQFLKYLQTHFPNQKFGPINILLSIKSGKLGIEMMDWGTLEQPNDRPTTLFPEDLLFS